MSFSRIRSDGIKVEIVSIDTKDVNFYQWGKNCANLEQDKEETRTVLATYGIEFTAEQSDEFWRGFTENKINATDFEKFGWHGMGYDND